jgi:tRNA threonylcarbamoyl adenosine modification protein YjeE
MRLRVSSDEEMQAHAASLLAELNAGDWVLLTGPLGAGKTTWTRGLLKAAGWTEAVRSPTYNLLHPYQTQPPILHADLYRLNSAEGVGLEEYLDAHLCVIEWPDRLGGLIDPKDAWQIEIDFEGETSRILTLIRPGSV